MIPTVVRVGVSAICLALAGCANDAVVRAQAEFKFETTDEPTWVRGTDLALDSHLRATPFDDAELALALPTLKRIKLGRLDLNGAPLTDAAADLLRQLPSVRTLGIAGTEMTARGIERLMDHPTLERIGVAEDAVSVADALELSRRFPKVRLRRMRYDAHSDLWGADQVEQATP